VTAHHARVSAVRRPTPLWWTEADDAELELLCFELCRAADVHREHCPVCRPLNEGGWCPPLVEAFNELLAWRDSRALASRAGWLRGRQGAREWLDEAKLAATAKAVA
jgi:hypothetical protein